MIDKLIICSGWFCVFKLVERGLSPGRSHLPEAHQKGMVKPNECLCQEYIRLTKVLFGEELQAGSYYDAQMPRPLISHT